MSVKTPKSTVKFQKIIKTYFVAEAEKIEAEVSEFSVYSTIRSLLYEATPAEFPALSPVALEDNIFGAKFSLFLAEIGKNLVVTRHHFS